MITAPKRDCNIVFLDGLKNIEFFKNSVRYCRIWPIVYPKLSITRYEKNDKMKPLIVQKTSPKASEIRGAVIENYPT
jgi:hypothetical protein